MNTLTLRRIIETSKGLLKIEPKVRASDAYSLSLIYTPGVGQVCLKIKETPEAIYDYCITSHAVALISDGSGFRIPIKHTNEIIPRLELGSVNGKFFYNIDYYPMIFDPQLTKNDDDFIQAIENIITTYRVVHLTHISKDRLKTLIPKLEAKKLPCTIFTDDVFLPMREELRSRNIPQAQAATNTYLFENALVRAVLDYRSYIQHDQLQTIVREEWERVKDEFLKLPDNLTDPLIAAYRLTINSIKSLGLEHSSMKHVMPRQLIQRMINYYMFGDSAFLNPWGKGHLLEKNSTNENSLVLHRRYNGMISIQPTFSPRSLEEFYKLMLRSVKLNEVDETQIEIQANPDLANVLTCKYNYGAIITNGTAVLGFGDLGPEAALPVMEGKSVLFKCLAGLDIMPICLKEKNVDQVVKLVRIMAPIFSAINLEDIKAPECYEIEQKCIEQLNIPIMHDDQHGTAVVCLAAIINGLKLMKMKPSEIKLIINGAGAAGFAICELLLGLGITNTIVCDTKGAIYTGRPKGMNKFKDKLATMTNPNKVSGNLTDIIKGAHMFVGVSVAGALSKDQVKLMAKNPFILALANPVPEIMPKDAYEAGAFIVATGRSDFKNQVNNSLCFPGIFRGAIATQSTKINLEMKLAAAYAIASLVSEKDLTPEFIIPPALSADVPSVVAKAVAEAAMKSGVARNLKMNASEVHDFTRKLNIDGLLPNVD